MIPPRAPRPNPAAVAAVTAVATTTPIATVAAGTATINISSSLPVLLEQRVSLLLGDFEVKRTIPPAPPASTNAFQFVIDTPTGGQFPVPTGIALLTRLRVDGVDSEIIAPLQPGQPESTPPEFDANKTITIT